jgi:DNA-binding MarR family transcriptional regulator
VHVIDEEPVTSSPDVVLDIERGISDLFGLARRVLRAYSAELHPELQPTGFSVLRIVFRHAPVQAGRVATLTGLDKSAVSRQIKFLRDYGLVQTTPDPRDGRSSFLVPTPLAEERMQALNLIMKRDYRIRVEGWSEDDLATFSRLLDRFNGPRDSSLD